MNVYEVNLSHIISNIRETRASLKPGCKFCAVVKANAYGMGAVVVAKEICDEVDYFAVARVEELEELRLSGVEKPILLLSGVNTEDIETVLKLNGEFQVHSSQQLEAISKQAKTNKTQAYVHIKFNTGMNRFGFNPNDAKKIKKLCKSLPGITIKGIFSHFAHASHETLSDSQNQTFIKACRHFKGVTRHIANSEAAHNGSYHHDMVRVGIDMYIGKNPAGSLKAQVVSTFKIAKGETAGYSQIFIANKECEVATIGIGYADGFPRAMIKSGNVLVQGKRCKVLAVCMDASIIDVSDLNVKVGDVVTIIGCDGERKIDVFEMAASCGTISYEILTGISPRVKRKYIPY